MGVAALKQDLAIARDMLRGLQTALVVARLQSTHRSVILTLQSEIGIWKARLSYLRRLQRQTRGL